MLCDECGGYGWVRRRYANRDGHWRQRFNECRCRRARQRVSPSMFAVVGRGDTREILEALADLYLDDRPRWDGLAPDVQDIVTSYAILVSVDPRRLEAPGWHPLAPPTPIDGVQGEPLQKADGARQHAADPGVRRAAVSTTPPGDPPSQKAL